MRLVRPALHNGTGHQPRARDAVGIGIYDLDRSRAARAGTSELLAVATLWADVIDRGGLHVDETPFVRSIMSCFPRSRRSGGSPTPSAPFLPRSSARGWREVHVRPRHAA